MLPYIYACCLMLYNFSGGLCDEAYVQKRMDRADEVDKSGQNLSVTLHPSGRDDMSILSMQRLNDQYVPLPLKSLLEKKNVKHIKEHFKSYLIFFATKSYSN